MERKTFTVTYELEGPMVGELNMLAERWSAIGRKITPEELFSLAMTMDGNASIRHYLKIVDRILRRQEA